MTPDLRKMSGLTIRKEDFQELDRCLRFYKKFDGFVKDVKISKFNEFYIECYDSTPNVSSN